MKIIRFFSGEKNILYGTYNQKTPAVSRIIEGNIFGDYKITSQDAQIVKLLAPLVPLNILALGINYKKHGDETAMSYPEQPILFLKATTSIVGHDGPIVLPVAGPDCVDYEAELALIIGKKAKNIKPAEVMDYIMGYTCANDVSARDWQFDKQKGQWARGKSFDRRKKLLVHVLKIIFGLCEQILNRKRYPVTQVGNGIAQHFEYGHTRVVDIIICPKLTGKLLNIIHAFCAQKCIVPAIFSTYLLWYC